MTSNCSNGSKYVIRFNLTKFIIDLLVRWDFSVGNRFPHAVGLSGIEPLTPRLSNVYSTTELQAWRRGDFKTRTSWFGL